MKRRLLLAAPIAVLAAGWGGCALAGERLGAQPQKPPTWKEIAATMTPTFDPRSPNPCQRGSAACIGIVLAEMRRRDAPLAAACDHRALFADLYTQLTARLGRAAAQPGRFHDAPVLRHFDAWFARYYFSASDAWRANRLTDVPGAWRVAFTAAAAHSVNGLGDLLLGMNAHITRDLPYVVAQLVPKPTTAVDPDFASITRLITGMSVPVLERTGARFDPTIHTAEIPLFLGGSRSFGQVIALWRTESWARGIALRDAAPSDRPAIEQQIETSATARAAAIVAATSYVPLLDSSKARDAYCRAHRG